MDVAITGTGIVSSLGVGAANFFDQLSAGVTKISAPPWAKRPEFEGIWVSNIEGFEPARYMPEKVAEGTDPFGQYLMVAADEALRDAGFSAPPDPDRTAVIAGTALGSVYTVAGSQHGLDTIGPDGISPKFHIRAWPNMGAAQIALKWKLHGPLMTIATACASSIDAIAHAARLVASGQADYAIAGGADASMTQLRVLSGARYGMFKPIADSRLASRPFDAARTGAVLGEGSGVVFLETYEAAKKRNARIYGRIRGAASLSDAHHVSSPGPQGTWQAETMRRALQEATREGDLGPVDAVMAHGTSTPVGDLSEIRAINQVFGADAARLRVTSLKGHIGHSAGGAGAMSLIAGLHGMAVKRVVATAGTVNVDPEARFIVPTFAAGGHDGTGPIRSMMVNAFGFGGQNASLVVSGA